MYIIYLEAEIIEKCSGYKYSGMITAIVLSTSIYVTQLKSSFALLLHFTLCKLYIMISRELTVTRR